MNRRGVHAQGPALFAADEMLLRPSVQQRLLRLAGTSPRAATRRELKADEDRRTIEQLRGWGEEIAGLFGLRYRAIEAERDDVVDYYGVCYEDGLICIRLRHAKTGRLLKESSLVDTLCHELAHLRYLDHSLRFQRLYRRILAKARGLGYYRPGPLQQARPIQLSLFDQGACGTRAPEGGSKR